MTVIISEENVSSVFSPFGCCINCDLKDAVKTNQMDKLSWFSYFKKNDSLMMAIISGEKGFLSLQFF